MTPPVSYTPEEDLDNALEAIFDAPPEPPKPSKRAKQSEQPPTTPTTPPPTSIPPTPELSPKKPPQKSILEHLAENSKRLTAGAARVAEDLLRLSEANTNNDKQKQNSEHGERNASESQERMVSKKAPIAAVMAARRNKRKKQPTKDAFTVIGRDGHMHGTAHTMKTYDYVDNKITNMSLMETPYEKARLEAIFEHTPRLDIADIKFRYEDLHTGALKDYTLFACLVKKIFKRQAKNGKMYAMWALCNMPRGKFESKEVPPTVVRMLVFDNAYESFHTRCEGTVFALRRPGILPKREGDREGVSHALRISKKENVVVLGVCKDFKLCETRRQGGELCGQWYHAHYMTSCPKHAKKRLAGLTTGTRMDIQNAVRPNIKDPSKKIRIPMDISGMRDDTENAELGQVERKQQLDLQRARDIKRREAENKLERAKRAAETVPVNVRDGERKKVARIDSMASVARETRQVRNRLGERHNRLLGRNDRQIRYHEACETLYSLGFKLRANGGWDPPERCDVTLVTTRTHKFSGLGRVQRRRNDGLGGAKKGREASGNELNETMSTEDDKLKNSHTGAARQIEQMEEEKMDVDIGNPAAEKGQESVGSPTSHKDIKPAGESMNDGKVMGETKTDSHDVPLKPNEEGKPTTRRTPEKIGSTENAEDILLSDESEED